jgi:hypothetical protein
MLSNPINNTSIHITKKKVCTNIFFSDINCEKMHDPELLNNDQML